MWNETFRLVILFSKLDIFDGMNIAVYDKIK